MNDQPIRAELDEEESREALLGDGPLFHQKYIDEAQAILSNLLHLLEFHDAELGSSFEDGQIFFQIMTAEAGRLIGRTSQTLDAVQFLLNRLLSRRYEKSPYCVVDTEQYRARRREKLLAETAAALERVRQNGRPWRMPPLNAMERRLIHQSLRDCLDIRTHSEEEDFEGRKRVVISLVELAPDLNDASNTDEDDPPAESPPTSEVTEPV